MFRLPKLASTITFPRIVQILYRKPDAKVFLQRNHLAYLIRSILSTEKPPIVEYVPGYLIQQISKDTFSWLIEQNIITSTFQCPIVPMGYELDGSFYILNRENDSRLIYYFERKAKLGLVKRVGPLSELEQYTYDHNKGE